MTGMGETAVARLDEGFTTEISVDEHALVSDEPEAVGGNGAGPTPYGLLLAALGACTAITVRMYADRKGWPLEHVRVELDHQRLHIKDCETCDEFDRKLDHMSLTLKLEGSLSDDQRRRLFEIAERCPVNRTLTTEVVVESQLA